jgi:hypothetical protein
MNLSYGLELNNLFSFYCFRHVSIIIIKRSSFFFHQKNGLLQEKKNVFVNRVKLIVMFFSFLYQKFQTEENKSKYSFILLLLLMNDHYEDHIDQDQDCHHS